MTAIDDGLPAATRADVDQMARVLMAEWERVEGKPVNVSYVATFADMARVALRAAREDVAETVALPWKWPFGAKSAARLVAHVSWPNDSQVDEWAPRLLDEPEIRESTIARAEGRFRQAIEAIRAGGE